MAVQAPSEGTRGAVEADPRHHRDAVAFDDLYGKPGGFQAEHKVYAREGQACSRCRATVVRHKWSGRSTFLCEACQV